MSVSEILVWKLRAYIHFVALCSCAVRVLLLRMNHK